MLLALEYLHSIAYNLVRSSSVFILPARSCSLGKVCFFCITIKTTETYNNLLVVAMYHLNGGRHEWMEHTDQLGTISYISVQVYAPVGGRSFSSVACRDLDCATFLHVSAAHIIFSLASYSISKQSLPLSGASSSIVGLCPATHVLFKAWQDLSPSQNWIEADRGAT